MKTMLPVVLVSFFLAASAEGQELTKAKVAVVRINSIVGGSNLYEKVRQMTADKDTLVAIKKINAELKDVQKQVIDTDDEVKLNDLSRKAQFLNQKLNILRQSMSSNNPNMDVQAIVRRFIVDNYKDKYHMILQQDSGIPDRFFVWKSNAETDDITDEVSEKFREYLDKSIGE